MAYLLDGKVHAVRGANVILACNNSLIPSLMPELPDKQRAALAYSVKVPIPVCVSNSSTSAPLSQPNET